MSVNLNGADPELVLLLDAVVGIWSIAITIYWMVVAWRAMRAHERLAAAVHDLSLSRRHSP